MNADAATEGDYDSNDERPSLAELALDGPVGPAHLHHDPGLSLPGGDPWGGDLTVDPGCCLTDPDPPRRRVKDLPS